MFGNSGFRIGGAAMLIASITAGCSQVSSVSDLIRQNVVETVANPTSVDVDTSFGPARPSGGFFEGRTNADAVKESKGVFGTTEQITIDDSGPFADNRLSVDTSLSDLSLEDQTVLEATGLDLANETALASGITFAADNGTTEFFDSDIGGTVYFGTDSSQLNAAAREVLRKQAAWLNVHTDVNVIVEGHTDERGTREYNLALGERRASAVRGYFTGLGIAADRVRKVSFGKERPDVVGSNDAAWSRNRRAVTILDPRDGSAADFSANQDFGSSPVADFGVPGQSQTSIDDLLNDPVLDSIPSRDPLLDDPLLTDPVLDNARINDPLLIGN